jgi:hypothetical protein
MPGKLRWTLALALVIGYRVDLVNRINTAVEKAGDALSRAMGGVIPWRSQV